MTREVKDPVVLAELQEEWPAYWKSIGGPERIAPQAEEIKTGEPVRPIAHQEPKPANPAPKG